MSSAFDTMFADAGVPTLMETLGTALVVYSDPEVDPVELTAIVGNMEVVEVEGTTSGGRRKLARRTFLITTDPAGTYGGVANPKLAARMEMTDGEVWEIESIEAQGSSMTKLNCVRKLSTELSRAGYRAR